MTPSEDGRGSPRWLRFILVRRPAWQRYSVSVLLSGVSLALFYALPEAASELSPLALFTVVLSALYGGLGPALLDTALTAVGIDFLFEPPIYAVFDSWSSVLRFLSFAAVGYVTAEIVSSLREAYARLRVEHEQTERAIRARDDVLAMVSHDLRSPLTSVLLGAEYLQRSAAERKPQDLHGTAAAILRSGRHMNRLIDDLLDAARMEQGRFRIEPRAHDLRLIAEEALGTVQAAAAAKGVRLHSIIPEGDYALSCDAGRIGQALVNLLGNAIKFSPEGAAVELSLEASRSRFAVSVADTGPGIAEDHLAHLFDRYWQAPASAHRGTGLGLFITRNIAEAHGGSVRVSSSPGRGSRFTLELPRNSDTPDGTDGL